MILDTLSLTIGLLLGSVTATLLLITYFIYHEHGHIKALREINLTILEAKEKAGLNDPKPKPEDKIPTWAIRKDSKWKENQDA